MGVLSLPYGDGQVTQAFNGSCGDPSPLHFTGKPRDAETGLDYFGARYNSSAQGRFLSPDPLNGTLANPQSWNRYLYTLDNPVNFTDPTGMLTQHPYRAPANAGGATSTCHDGFNCSQAQAQHRAEIRGRNAAAQRNGSSRVMHPGHSAQQQNNSTVTVTVEQVKSNQPYGHSVISVGGDKPVGLVPKSDAAAGAALANDIVNGGPTPVPGQIKQNSATVKRAAILHVTPKQAAAMRTYIAGAEHQSQAYEPLYRNCSEWVEGVLRAGSIKAPNDITPEGLVVDLRKEYPQ